MRSELSLKLRESQSINDQIEAFFAKGKTIDVIPSHIYKREEITDRDRRTILETSRHKIRTGKTKSGDAMREVDRIAYKKAKIDKGEL